MACHMDMPSVWKKCFCIMPLEFDGWHHRGQDTSRSVFNKNIHPDQYYSVIGLGEFFNTPTVCWIPMVGTSCPTVLTGTMTVF